MAIEAELLADLYLRNRCTPEEAAIVLDWFGTETGARYLLDHLHKDVKLLENDTLFISPVNVPGAEILGNILTSIEEPHPFPLSGNPAKTKASELKLVPLQRRGFKQWHKVAAVFAGLSLGVLISYQYFTGNTISRSTRYGETARFILPDSSLVTLNGNSRITYSGDWKSNETRKVKLEGEAFFSVRHKTNNQKFIVDIADTIQIEVLGTTFNVSDRKRETQVVLVSGRIQLNMRGKQATTSMIMKPGESVEIMPLNGIRHKQVVDPEVVISWTSNKLIFNNTSVREICDRLKDTYGYQIEISDPDIMKQQITGSVPSQSIDMVLEGLEAILGVKCKKAKE